MEFYARRKSSIGLDMAPLIDVIFLLLIFFMLSSSFMRPTMELNLPKAVSADEQTPEVLAISADKAGHLALNGKDITLEGLEAAVRRELENNPEIKQLHVHGDRDMPYGIFVQIMDRARMGGISQVNIVHDVSSSGEA